LTCYWEERGENKLFDVYNKFLRRFKMKMKQSIAILSLIIFTASCGFASTAGSWQGAPAGDANKPAGSGNWKDAYWNKEMVVLPKPVSGSEIKIIKQGTSCLIDSNAGNFSDCKLTIGGGTDLSNAAKLEIANGGYIAIGEARIGSGGSAKSGTAGFMVQTGGTLCLSNKLFVGRYGTSSENPLEGKGFYTISGGTLKYAPANPEGGMYIGCAGSGGKCEGTFTVAGKKPTINLKKLYIGSDGKKNAGRGTLEFEVEPNGVAPIKIVEGVFIDLNGQESKAYLNVNADASAPKADILLIDTVGTAAVKGVFDTVNGQAGAEGANISLKTGDGSYNYKLTYAGGNGNDVVLKYVNFVPKTQ
jgi:hypothetical protein